MPARGYSDASQQIHHRSNNRVVDGYYPDHFYPDAAEGVSEDAQSPAFSKALETFFTISVIFSTTLMPFVLIQILAPAFMTMIVSGALVWLLVPYVVVMVIAGLKIASLFGCSAWSRVVDGWHGER